MAFCLPPEFTNKFLTALKDGTIQPEALVQMSSEERRDFLGKIVGEDNAKDVNALLESKLLLKDQQAGLVAWAKQTAGLKDPARRDLVSRIEKLDRVLNPTEERAFLADLAAQKLGATVTMDETKALYEGAQKVKELRAAIPEDSPIGSQERMAYGLASDDFHQMFAQMKGTDSLLDLAKQKKIGKLAVAGAGAVKGMQASMDMSALLRQGLKTLLTHPIVWTRNAVDLIAKVGMELKGQDGMRFVRADVASRPNALSGAYKAMGVDLGIGSEEALPSALPEHIPLYGRLYKASETAFNGFMLMLRADLADQMITAGKTFGIDMLNPAQAEGLGQLVNSMTGRGTVPGLTPGGHQAVNALFYSIKFLKSNYDTLTGHSFGFGIKDAMTRQFVRQQAAKNLGKILLAEAGLLGTAYLLNPDSTSLDPRSSLFGKIKLGQTTFDVTAGMGPLVTLVSRLIPTSHNGEIGLWSESQAGKWTNLTAGKYGQQTGMDVLMNFFEGRLSPVAGVVRDHLKGETYQGTKPTLTSDALNLVTPLDWQNFQQSQSEPNAAVAVGSMIADFLGGSPNPPNALNIGLPRRDPVELELIKAGFGPRDFEPRSGNDAFDARMHEHMGPLVEQRLAGLIGSRAWQQMGEAQRAYALQNIIKSIRRQARGLAINDDRAAFAKMQKDAHADPRKDAMMKELMQP